MAAEGHFLFIGEGFLGQTFRRQWRHIALEKQHVLRCGNALQRVYVRHNLRACTPESRVSSSVIAVPVGVDQHLHWHASYAFHLCQHGRSRIRQPGINR